MYPFLEMAPPPLRWIVRRALQPEPDLRFTAGQLRDELHAYLLTLDPPTSGAEIAAEPSAIKVYTRWEVSPAGEFF